MKRKLLLTILIFAVSNVNTIQSYAAYEHEASVIDYFSIVLAILCIIFVLVSVKLKSKYKKNYNIEGAIEAYPPKGYNPAEIGFLYEGKVNEKMIASLLITLANKGYIKIQKINKKIGMDFKVIKIKQYDGKDPCEEKFFDFLFERSNKEIIEKMDIIDSFQYCDIIKWKVASKENKNKVFDEVANGKRRKIILMVIVTFVMMIVQLTLSYIMLEMFDYMDLELLVIGIMFTCMGFSLPMMCCKKERKFKLGGIVIFIMFGIMPYIFILLPILSKKVICLISYNIAVISANVMIKITDIIHKRTEYGIEMLNKISGLKKFIITAKGEELENLIRENKNYYYDILPYTYALDISDIWTKKFSTIQMQAPIWYEGYQNFNISEFNKFMNYTIKSIQNTMMPTSPPTLYV